LTQFDETYEISAPVVSIHNLVPIMGSMYIDIGDKATVINLKNPDEKCELQFHRRGWFTSEKCKVTGYAFR